MPQLDLFGTAQSDQIVSQRPDPERIRLVLAAALQELRKSESMPWDSARLRSWHHVFQNMTKWLPDEERESFTRSFNVEVGRLRGELPIFNRSVA